MSHKSNWVGCVDDDFWSQNQSCAFNFDDIDDQLASGLDEPSLSSEPSVVQTKSSHLQLPQSLVQNQIEKCLTQLEKQCISSDTKKSSKDVISLMSKGLDINLNEYKGLDEKLSLLDRALESNEGNVIISVVLHLERTIKPSTFNYELSKRCLAADHYLFYLKQKQRIGQLMDTLSMLGRHEEAAITAYTHAITCCNIDTKISHLKSCLRNHLSTGGAHCVLLTHWISEHISLLELQLPIDSYHNSQHRQGLNQVFKQIPPTPLIDLPLISSLYSCCLYDYDLPENHLASPKAILKTFQLTEKQFIWTAISALAKTSQWSQIDVLFHYKSWFGNKRVKSCISFDKVVYLLHRNNAPQEVLIKYLQLIDEFDIKFNMAKETKLIKLMVDPFIRAKDRKKLEDITTKLDLNSDDYVYVQNALLNITLNN